MLRLLAFVIGGLGIGVPFAGAQEYPDLPDDAIMLRIETGAVNPSGIAWLRADGRTTTGVELFDVRSDALLLSPHTVWVVLDEGQPVVFQRRKDSSGFEGARTWWGTREDRPQDLILTRTESGVIGTVVVGTTEIQIYEVGGRSNVQVLAGESEYEGCAAGTLEQPEQYGLVDSLPSHQSDSTGGRSSESSSESPVLDLLVVYNSVAEAEFATDTGGYPLREAMIHHVEGINAALEASHVAPRVRLVGVERIAWTTSVPAGANLASLRISGDGNGDVVHGIRDALGADSVMGIIPKQSGQGGLGYSGSPSAGYSFSVVNTNALYRSTAHEYGHNMGLKHWDDGGDSSNLCPNPTGQLGGRFPFQWPDPDIVTDPSSICEGEPFHTKLGGSVVVIDGTTFPTGPRLHRYSNAHLTVSRACADGQFPRNVPTGRETPNDADCRRDAAQRIEAVAPGMANFRPTVVPDPATIWFPPVGSYLSGSTATFYWTNNSPTGNYGVEVWQPDGGGTHQSWFGTSTSASFSGLSTTAVIAVRVWSEQSSGLWQWTDHRFNSDRRVVSCSNEERSILPFHDGTTTNGPPEPIPVYATSCDVGSGPVCEYLTSSDRLECRLSKAGYISNVGRAFSNFGTGATYDIAVHGRSSFGIPFCCLMHDPSGDVSLTIPHISSTRMASS